MIAPAVLQCTKGSEEGDPEGGAAHICRTDKIKEEKMRKTSSNRSIAKSAIALGLAAALTACSSTAASSAVASSAAPSEAASGTEASEDEVWLPYDENFEKKRDERDATGKTGAVASCNWYASKAGLDILKEGGNAFDAAAAVAYTLGVAEPYFSGLGGGGFMTIYSADEDKVSVIDFRETAPAAANAQMWLDENGEMKQFSLDGTNNLGTMSSIGGLSVAVPGEVAGFEYLLEHYGSDAVTRQQIFQPAIDTANNGFVVGVTFKEEMESEYSGLAANETLSNIYLNEAGLPYEVGDVITNPDLAKTLQLIADGGKDAFYTGDMAQAMVDAVADWGGNMTMEDLANYEVKVREPVVGHYKDYTIYSLPPASSGGTHLVEILNILENYDDMDTIGVNSAEYVHRFSEAFKIAFADRAQYMADTDFAEVPLAQLTSKEYAAERYSEITEKSGSYVAVEPEELEHYATTSFSVVDQWGNMVACTKTINYGFGSKVGVPGYGFIMNDEMDDFSADPESVNCAEGGKRPLSSMSPSIVLYPDGSPYMTIGSPGATRIFPTIAQVIERMIDYDMDIQDAIDCARIYDNASENICYESGGVNPITAEVAAELQERGHEVTDKGEWQLFFGGVQGISIAQDGTLRGGADPRRDGKALAY